MWKEYRELDYFKYLEVIINAAVGMKKQVKERQREEMLGESLKKEWIE